MRWGSDLSEMRESVWWLKGCPGYTSPQQGSPASTAMTQNTLMGHILRGEMEEFHPQLRSFFPFPQLCLHPQPPIWVAATLAICIFLPHTVDLTIFIFSWLPGQRLSKIGKLMRHLPTPSPLEQLPLCWARAGPG